MHSSLGKSRKSLKSLHIRDSISLVLLAKYTLALRTVSSRNFNLSSLCKLNSWDWEVTECMHALNTLRYEVFKTRWCQAFCVFMTLTTRLSTGKLANQSVLQGTIIRKLFSYNKTRIKRRTTSFLLFRRCDLQNRSCGPYSKRNMHLKCLLKSLVNAYRTSVNYRYL